MVGNTQSDSAANTSTKFGRNQKIGMIWITLPFVVATACLFSNKCNFDQWALFMRFLVPISMAIILGFSVALDSFCAFAASRNTTK